MTDVSTIEQIRALLERVTARAADASPSVRQALITAMWDAVVALAPGLSPQDRVAMLECVFAPGGVGGPTAIKVTERFLPVIERLAELGIVDPAWKVQVVPEAA